MEWRTAIPEPGQPRLRRGDGRAGIDCTLHGLRHTHVSQLIAEGLDVLTISRRIGHASRRSR